MPARENVFLSRRAQMIPGYGFVGKDERIPKTGKIMETAALARLTSTGALQSANPIDSDVDAEPSVTVVAVAPVVDVGVVIRPAGLSPVNLELLPAGTELDKHVLPVAVHGPSEPVVPVIVEVVTAATPVFEPVGEDDPVVVPDTEPVAEPAPAAEPVKPARQRGNRT